MGRESLTKGGGEGFLVELANILEIIMLPSFPRYSSHLQTVFHSSKVIEKGADAFARSQVT